LQRAHRQDVAGIVAVAEFFAPAHALVDLVDGVADASVADAGSGIIPAKSAISSSCESGTPASIAAVMSELMGMISKTGIRPAKPLPRHRLQPSPR